MPGDVRTAAELPERYIRSGTYSKLRVCERFGQPPAWIDEQEPGVAALLLEFERVREAEEERQRPL